MRKRLIIVILILINDAMDAEPEAMVKKVDKAVSALFILIVIVAAWIWAVSVHAWSLMGTLASLVCLGLFIWTGLRAIPALTGYISSWNTQEPVSINSLPEERQRTWWKIVFWVVASRVLLILIAYVFWMLKDGVSGSLFSRFIDTWHIRGIDAMSYLGIAEHGYVTEGDSRFHIVFLPLFPVIIKLAQFFTGNYMVAGFVAANLCTLAAALFAYELARLDMGRSNALRVVKYIFIFPSAFFFFIPMTEALFLLLSLMALYYVRQKRWLLGCLCAALAGFTRSPGILLAVPVAVEFARDLAAGYRQLERKAFINRLVKAVVSLATVSFGLLAYLYINYNVTGNAFQFSIYQREHWSQQFYFFFDTVRYQMEYAVKTFKDADFRSFLGLWLPNLISIFLVLLMMFKSAKRLHPAYMAYLIVYFVYVVGPTWLLSAPRYFAVAFPLAFAAVVLTQDKKWKDIALTSLFIAGSLLYLAVFVAGYPVY
jgi:Gpi18-like mannosyltransferase